MVATTPLGKRRIALEKLAAHLTLLWLSMADPRARRSSPARSSSATRRWATRSRSVSRLGFALWVGVIAMFFGGLAFALAPLLGRAGSAGVALLVDGRALARERPRDRRPLAAISPFHWTVDHIPLVGFYDWLACSPSACWASCSWSSGWSCSSGATSA